MILMFLLKDFQQTKKNKVISNIRPNFCWKKIKKRNLFWLRLLKILLSGLLSTIHQVKLNLTGKLYWMLFKQKLLKLFRHVKFLKRDFHSCTKKINLLVILSIRILKLKMTKVKKLWLKKKEFVLVFL